MIELIRLTKSYNGQPVLNQIQLTIRKGSIFGIIGKSGAGKSTLLRMINGLERPEKGEVHIDGENLSQKSEKALRQMRHQMGMIFQQFNLVNTQTVAENIALPLKIQGMDKKTIQNKINELLPLVELSDKRQARPHELSGGQKQRVAIARALATSPRILLCDEATSALDPETTESILGLLQKINSVLGITIVLITHEMDVIKRICTELAVLDKGHLIETTTVIQALTSKDSMAKTMLHHQLSPKLPPCLKHQLTTIPNKTPLLRLFFEGEGATVPFISHVSRELNLDINILLANLDRFDAMTSGVLVVQLNADKHQLKQFFDRCEQFKITVEILGYVTHAPD